jgi:hypothetical protein
VPLWADVFGKSLATGHQKERQRSMSGSRQSLLDVRYLAARCRGRCAAATPARLHTSRLVAASGAVGINT